MPRMPSTQPRQPSKPYAQTTLSFPTTATNPPSTKQHKVQDEQNPASDPNSPPAPRYKAKGGEYNKQHLVALVIKVSPPLVPPVADEKSASPDWEKLASSIGKTPIRELSALRGRAEALNGAECRDTWRKTICPALLDGRDWSLSGPGWDSRMKVAAVAEVITVSYHSHVVMGIAADMVPSPLVRIGRSSEMSWEGKLLLVSYHVTS